MRYDFPNILPAVIDRIWQKITMFWYRSRSPMLAWFWGVKHKGGVRFQGKTIIRTHRVGEILLGRNVVFNAQKVANLVGLMGSNILHVFNGGRIVVGDNTGFSSVVLSSRSAIKIGSRVKVGGNVRIFDHDFHSTDSVIRASSKDRDYVRSKPIVIEASGAINAVGFGGDVLLASESDVHIDEISSGVNLFVSPLYST